MTGGEDSLELAPLSPEGPADGERERRLVLGCGVERGPFPPDEPSGLVSLNGGGLKGGEEPLELAPLNPDGPADGEREERRPVLGCELELGPFPPDEASALVNGLRSLPFPLGSQVSGYALEGGAGVAFRRRSANDMPCPGFLDDLVRAGSASISSSSSSSKV